MSEVSRGYAVGVLASCVVHAGIVLGMPRNSRASERTAEQPVWLELQVQSSLAAPAPQQPPAPAPSVERDTREITRAAPSRRERSAQLRPAQEVTQPVERTADAVAVQPAPSAPRAASIDLSPLAAARTLSATFFPAPDSGVKRDEPPLSHAQEADTLAQQVPGLRPSNGSARSIEGAVVDAVEDTLYNVLRPWKLLSKTMRGSEYRYTGAGFDAAILPNGQVRFREKSGPSLVTRTTPTREFGASAQLPPANTLELNVGDPSALWSRLRGKDPHAAERRLFLERTRALREHLAGRANEHPTPPERSDDLEPSQPQLEPPASPLGE